MSLTSYLARSCYYAQEHIDDADAWDTSPDYRENLLQCVSFQVACFLAQNTVEGCDGVDWNVVIPELREHPMKSLEAWNKIIEDHAVALGGWKPAKVARKANRRAFNKIGCPELPPNPTAAEIAQFLTDSATWEKLQPRGHGMDAREWASIVLLAAVDQINNATRQTPPRA